MVTNRILPITLICLGLGIPIAADAAQMPAAGAAKPGSAPAGKAICPVPEAVFEGSGRHEDLIPPRPEVWPMTPPYPKTLHDRTQHGVVLSDYTVGRDGVACNIHVTAVQGPQDFADAATTWLASTPFAPATKAGQPIVAEVKRVMNFRGMMPRSGVRRAPDSGIPPSANQAAPDDDDDK